MYIRLQVYMDVCTRAMVTAAIIKESVAVDKLILVIRLNTFPLCKCH